MAALYFFATTNTPNRFYPYTGRNRFFFTTNTPNRFFPFTTRNRFFFGTNSPNRYFFTTLPPQRTTELQLMMDITMSTDCSAMVITDVTGTYPVTEGGYNPEPDANIPLRAKRSQVQLWIVFRVWNADGTYTIVLPDTQNNVTPNFAYVFDTALGDAIIEVIMIGAPIAEDWNDWKADESLVEYAEAYWYSSGIGLLKGCGVMNCYNSAQQRFVDQYMCNYEVCDFSEMVQLDTYLTMIQSAIAKMDYQQAAINLAAMTDFCADENNQHNCNCGC